VGLALGAVGDGGRLDRHGPRPPGVGAVVVLEQARREEAALAPFDMQGVG